MAQATCRFIGGPKDGQTEILSSSWWPDGLPPKMLRVTFVAEAEDRRLMREALGMQGPPSAVPDPRKLPTCIVLYLRAATFRRSCLYVFAKL